MDELHEQRQQRVDKLGNLQEKGIRPFGTRFPVSHTLEDILASFSSRTKEELEQSPSPCQVAGRIIALRRFG